MHRSTVRAVAALTIGLSVLTPAAVGARDGIDDAVSLARRHLDRRDARSAVALLESTLARTPAARQPPLVAMLRDAYPAAARQADGEGKRDEAETYRDNLAIIEAASKSVRPLPGRTPTAASGRPAEPSAAPPEVVAPATLESATPLPLPADTPAEPVAATPSGSPSPGRLVPLPNGLKGDAPATTAPAATPDAEPTGPTPEAVPPLTAPRTPPPVAAAPVPAPTPVEVPLKSAAVATPTPSAPGGDATVEAGDAAFVAKRYEDAGRIYLSLDSARKLPVDRRDHWAYCRAYDVVRRINARPASAGEWAAIDAEIETIRALSPTNWFAEYLHNRAKERNPGSRPAKTQRSGKIVVRGSSPEEPPPGPAAPTGPPPVQAPAPQPAPLPPQGSALKWSPSPVITANFQVVYPEGQKALAEQVARGAEEARGSGFKRWGDPNKGLGWTPRCEVVIFPTAADLCRETDQPADSPGFSTMGMNDGKIVFRRVHVRADHPTMIKAILPHEVTHVVLADLFPTQQIPRWADEGMAVLMEPAAEQHVRAADLEAPLAAGRLFHMGDLMTMDYPSPQDLPLYYAQSVSLTRFLVDQGTPTQFVAFVREAQRAGFEPALKSVYKFKGYGELQDRWVSYAKSAPSTELTASSSPRAATAPAGRR